MENKKLKEKIFQDYDSYTDFLADIDISRPTLFDLIKNRTNANGKTIREITKILNCKPEDVNLEY